MIKKVILIVGGLGLVAFLFLGRDATSFLGTSYDRMSEAVHDNIPTEFQIDRARKMVKALEPEIRECVHVIAKEEVEVEKLTKEIDRKETQSDKDKGDLVRLHTDLAENRSTYTYAGHRYTVNEVRQDMARRLERIKTNDATLGSLSKMRDARQRNLDAARKKLAAMVAAQRQLSVEVENLEAKLKLVEVAQASSDFTFDDSKLARAKELISQIRTDLDVAAKLASADVDFHGEIPLDAHASEDIDDRVAAYLGLNGPDADRLAEASFVHE